MEQQQGVIPDPDAEYRLFDRVINTREGFTVPLGLRGTVIGIKGGEDISFILISPYCLKFYQSFSTFCKGMMHVNDIKEKI